MPSLPSPRLMAPIGDTPTASEEDVRLSESKFVALLRELQRAHEEEVSAVRRQYGKLAEPEHAVTSNRDMELVDDSPEPSVDIDAATKEGGGAEDLGPAQHKASWKMIVDPREYGLSDIATRMRKQDFGSRNALRRFVSSTTFEVLFCALVLLNSLVIAFESQYDGQDIGYRLGYTGHHLRAAEQYPHAEIVLNTLAWIFGILFILEILLRLYASMGTCIKDGWVWLDVAILVVWVVSKVLDAVSYNSTVLRLGRLFRLLHILKLARSSKGFDALFIIATAMRGCMPILWWTFVMLGLVQLVLSLALSQYLHNYYFTLPLEGTDQILVFQYYGTFVRCFFTFLEIALGNWPPACRVLAENVGEVFFLLGMIHKLAIGFAVVAIINGVFIQETFKVTAMDDVIMLRQKQQAIAHHINKMKRLWKEADASRDGYISFDEWEQLTKDPGVKTWLASMELDASDAHLIFELLDESKDGKLSFEELVTGMSKFRGAAKSIELQTVCRQLQKINMPLH
eukprot:TRINITY_DN29238_c0_g1_i1.p1 TRINITY_DN29238_c0_g1~~TRINITY_DN29238_c0_g1_i1.p1  ORF type:complete len:527 (+),score=81.81 TRINITY_DN29238_c0_g1_i1:48-1583(+)